MVQIISLKKCNTALKIRGMPKVTQSYTFSSNRLNAWWRHDTWGLDAWLRHDTSETCQHFYLELVDSHPTVWRKLVKHRHQKHEASRPVAHQCHHTDEIEDSNEDMCHVGKLLPVGCRGICSGRGEVLFIITTGGSENQWQGWTVVEVR